MSLAKWSEYKWPKWVPHEVRFQIESFWSNEWGRDFHQWLEGCYASYNNQPKLGSVIHVKCPSYWGYKSKVRVGKWIPAWNNIARIKLRDGTIRVVSTCDIVKGERTLRKPAKHRTTQVKTPPPATPDGEICPNCGSQMSLNHNNTAWYCIGWPWCSGKLLLT